jgi:hypothetical protein
VRSLTVPILTSGALIEVHLGLVYDVSLVLGGLATVSSLGIDPLPVMATAFINHPFEGLLGRDVLSRVQMAWRGPTQSLTLSYP